jgi:hypothetical protein
LDAVIKASKIKVMKKRSDGKGRGSSIKISKQKKKTKITKNCGCIFYFLLAFTWRSQVFSATYERISLNPTKLAFIFNMKENNINLIAEAGKQFDLFRFFPI